MESSIPTALKASYLTLEGTGRWIRTCGILIKVYSIYPPSQEVSSYKRPAAFDAFQPQKRARLQPLNLKHFNKALIKWAVLDQHSLRKATSNNLYELLKTINPDAANLLYSSYNSLRQKIVELYNRRINTTKGFLAEAKSKVNLSFDIWRSDNKFLLLGICGHYIDYSY